LPASVSVSLGELLHLGSLGFSQHRGKTAHEMSEHFLDIRNFSKTNIHETSIRLQYLGIFNSRLGEIAMGGLIDPSDVDATPSSVGGLKISGPKVEWKGRKTGPRQSRRWARAWSPEQIARRLPLDFPDDTEMRISHEAIYQTLFIQGRGGLRRELTACLRSGRALRTPRARTRGKSKSFVSPEIMISERPAEAEDRAVPGHWEGDLILGLHSSAIGTLVERTTRFTMPGSCPTHPLGSPSMARYGIRLSPRNFGRRRDCPHRLACAVRFFLPNLAMF
jgi:hypothetical protein